jgi:hypothetical protein
MKEKRVLWMSSTALLLVLAIGWPALAQNPEESDPRVAPTAAPEAVPPQQPPSPPKVTPEVGPIKQRGTGVDLFPQPQSATVFSTHSCGSGNSFFKIGISDHGNLVRLESPSGVVHLSANEGYVICDNTPPFGEFVDGYDAGAVESGCGAPTIVQPNGPNTLPLTITRLCGGCIEFKQEFTAAGRDCKEHDLAITMTLKLVCSDYGTFQNVRVARYFDGDLGGDATDDVYGIGFHSALGLEGGGVAAGLSLTATSFNTSHFGQVESFNSWSKNTCIVQHDVPGLVTSSQGDYVGRVTYNLGSLAVGQSKKVTVTYRHF